MTTIDVVYEDADLMVVVKPANMVTHPAYMHPDGTLWNMLVEMFQARGLQDRPHMLHRLDRNTSGLLCVPKHAIAHRALERAMRRGAFEKRYLALVIGSSPGEGMIDAPLGRDPANTRQVCVRSDGQASRTHYSVIRRFAGHTLLRVTLETGRMHQIRVHLAHIGHPIVGDSDYGVMPTPIVASHDGCGHHEARPEDTRLFLHADHLCFPHPMRNVLVHCHAPLPRALKCALVTLR